MKHKSLFLYFLFFIFLVLLLSLTIIAKVIFTGSFDSKKIFCDDCTTTRYDDLDKDKKDKKIPDNCFQLDSGKLVCKIGMVEIEPGEVFEDDFKIKKSKD